jgi:putative inorganic carbon (HCO3(-)) transporter
MNFSTQGWGESSYVHRLFGVLRAWRQSSWLLQWADEIGAVFVLLVIGLAPFLSASTALIGLLLFACAAYWLLLTLTDDTDTGTTPIHLLVLLYWVINTVATALSPVKVAAFEGWLKLTLYLMLFALMARVLRSPLWRSLLITVYLHVATIVSIVGLRQWFFGADALATWVDPTSPLAGTTRVYSYLGNPNLLASYLIPAIVLSGTAIFAWKHRVAKLLAGVLVVVNAACLVLTFSRGGWIGFVISGFLLVVLLVYWWSVYLPRFWRIWTLPLVLGISTAVVVLAVAFIEPLQERVLSIFAGSDDSSNNFRLNVWAAVHNMIRDRPILGIGPGNDAFNKVYPLYQRTGYTALSAYSIYLDIIVETGFIGFATFLWLLLVTFNQGWTRLHQLRQTGNREGFWLMGALAAMCGLLAHGLVDTVWYRPQINTLWWLMMALVATYYVYQPVGGQPRPGDRQLEDPIR